MVAKKKTAKAAEKEKKSEVNVPAGFRPVSGQFSDTWDPANNPEHPVEIIGTWGKEKTVTLRRGRGTQESRVCKLTTEEDVIWTVWMATHLEALFDEAEEGDTVYIRFDGLGTAKKRGNNPPKLFTSAIAE